MISCVAVLGGDDSLIFIHKAMQETTPLEMDILVYTALEAFKSKSSSRIQTRRGAQFFGIQIQSERFVAWGYRPGLRYKVIVLTNAPAQPGQPPESPSNAFFERLRAILFDGLCNPFYQPFSPLLDQKTKDAIEALCRQE